MYMRNSFEVLRELYGRPEFARHLIFAPEQHFVIVGDGEEPEVSDMHTGSWWWWIQVRMLAVLVDLC